MTLPPAFLGSLNAGTISAAAPPASSPVMLYRMKNRVLDAAALLKKVSSAARMSRTLKKSRVGSMRLRPLRSNRTARCAAALAV